VACAAPPQLQRDAKPASPALAHPPISQHRPCLPKNDARLIRTYRDEWLERFDADNAFPTCIGVLKYDLLCLESISVLSHLVTMPGTRQCNHTDIQHEASTYAQVAGFQRPAAARRLAATTQSGRNPPLRKGVGGKTLEPDILSSADEFALSFPGPLVLPHDHLALDPKDPPQSFRSWLLEKERNKPTKDQRTLYVAAVPQITTSMRHMKNWSEPKLSKAHQKRKTTATLTESLASPRSEDVIAYLSAFYYGLAVKHFPERLRFIPWREKASKSEQYVGLATANNCTRIRARPSPDGLYSGQLNLEDILDAAIEMLPEDAYALLLLVDQDLYEDEEDDFCCGRAYGGSRVCVVSSARYHPVLDEQENIDYAHMWPASHCSAFVEDICRREVGESSTKAPQPHLPSISPIRAAVNACDGLSSTATLEDRQGLWFSRLVRTVSHELGHCLGMDHCSYYACVMQGTAGMAEDVRQPPYLCPVCLGKITHAVAHELQAGNEDKKQVYIKERYEALIQICDKWKHVGLFAGYSAWIRVRLGTAFSNK
jgi:archaemetzincin